MEILDYFQKIIGEYKKRRDVVFEGLMAIEGTVCMKASGAFYAMAKLPISSAEEFAKFMLTEFSVDNKTVMVAPGPGFYATPGRGVDECRIAYVLNTDDLADAMIREVGRTLVKSRYARRGDDVVITASLPKSDTGKTNFLKIHRIPAGGPDGN